MSSSSGFLIALVRKNAIPAPTAIATRTNAMIAVLALAAVSCDLSFAIPVSTSVASTISCPYCTMSPSSAVITSVSAARSWYRRKFARYESSSLLITLFSDCVIASVETCAFRLTTPFDMPAVYSSFLDTSALALRSPRVWKFFSCRLTRLRSSNMAVLAA